MEQVDLLIIGAGWHGIAMAKTYREVRPEAKLMMIDSAHTVGGVWARERLYPGLKTNNIIGSYEFSDFPMIPERYKLKAGQHISGQAVHEYLSEAVERFNLTSCLRLATNASTAELRSDGLWLVQISPSTVGRREKNFETSHIVASKLVLATGLTSEPSLPSFSGQHLFKGPILHSRQLKEKAEAWSSPKSLVVVGGNKSAWDVCYGAAKSGTQVHMVIRPSGGGPSWVWPTSCFGFLRTSPARLSSYRYLTWFDPHIWTSQDGSQLIRAILHKTWIGRVLLWTYWAILGRLIQFVNGYDSHPGTAPLRPWTTPYWMGMSLSIHNYDTSWFDMAREGKVSVHIADIDHLSEQAVHLTNGEKLDAEALVCCTGWKPIPPIKFVPDDLPSKLGVPATIDNKGFDAASKMMREQILRHRPDLRRAPRTMQVESGEHNENKVRECFDSPYQLYRYMVPYQEPFLLARRNIAFIGCQLALLAVTVAQVQALWITAFFEDKIDDLQSPRLQLDMIKYETLLHTEFQRIRHPPEAGGAGSRCPDLVFDCLPYVDALLKDLGMSTRRKKGNGAWWREWFERYTMKEYRGLVREWKDLQGM